MRNCINCVYNCEDHSLLESKHCFHNGRLVSAVEYIYLLNLFVVLTTCGASISMISISLDVRKVQKSKC